MLWHNKLEADSRTFASQMQRLLNTTVTNGISLQTIVLKRPDVFVPLIGYKVRDSTVPQVGIPLTVSNRPAKLFANVFFRMCFDDEQKFLAVQTSQFGLYADELLTRCLLRFDYERNKPDGFPEAHIQVHATSSEWRSTLTNNEETRQLHSLHLPVGGGGRRFRPSLEDFIKFLIDERLVTARSGANSVIEKGQKDFERIQLSAAIRRDSELTKTELVDLRESVTDS